MPGYWRYARILALCPDTVRILPLGSPTSGLKQPYVHVRVVTGTVPAMTCDPCGRSRAAGGVLPVVRLGGYWVGSTPLAPTQYLILVLPGPNHCLRPAYWCPRGTPGPGWALRTPLPASTNQDEIQPHIS